MLKEDQMFQKVWEETITNPKEATKGISDQRLSQNCSVDTRNKHSPGTAKKFLSIP